MSKSKPRDRECVTCGEQIFGRDRECYTCKAATPRTCLTCGRVFRSGNKRTCAQCLAAERQCVTCGATFAGRYLKCPGCRPIGRRKCTACDRVYRGTQLLCPTCRLTDRECVICGASFCGLYRKCSACRNPEHPCVTCGHVFAASNSQCQECRKSDRTCITCGKTHRRLTLECDSCSGRTRTHGNARRARKLAAEVAGPVPRSVYIEVVASGPCVYCGAAATHVDHIRPLVLGGHEARYNLAPACQPCNQSKGAKLLIHWDPVRVAHGAAHFPAVAAELDRELAQVLIPPHCV